MSDVRETGIDWAQCEASGRPSFEDLYRAHNSWLRKHIAKRLRLAPPDADDIVQDTYLRVARAQTADISHPRAFLARIAVNLFRDGQRRADVRSAHGKTVRSISAAEQQSTGMWEQEAALQLGHLVSAMPEPYRDVFVLSRFRMMSNKNIAAHLGISIKTVEWRMSKALDICMSGLRG